MTQVAQTTDLITYRIYCATNHNNGKKYVGQTRTTIKKRWNKHVWLALTKRANTRFAEAIRKHGPDVFELSLLHEVTCTQDAADEFERTWIRVLKTVDPMIGYNMTDGGNTQAIVKLSPDACEKIRQSKLGKPLLARTRKTDEKHRPIVDGFKTGKSRKQLAEEFNLPHARIVKILLRWKELHEPELPVGLEHQYASSGASLRRNALERNQHMIDMVVKEGKTRKQVAVELGLSYAQVKQVLFRYGRRSQGIEVT